MVKLLRHLHDPDESKRSMSELEAEVNRSNWTFVPCQDCVPLIDVTELERDVYVFHVTHLDGCINKPQEDK